MRKTTMIFFALMVMLLMAMPAFAQGGNAAASGRDWAVPLASGLGIAFAAGMAGLGQGKVGAAACEAMARNPAARPAIQLALILGLAFIESLVLFALVIIIVKAV